MSHECKPRNPRWTDWDMTVVHTPSKAEYERVLEMCGSPGHKDYDYYRENTCVNVSSIEGVYKYQYSDINWYRNDGCTIITFAELLKRMNITYNKKEEDTNMSVSPQEVRNLKMNEEQRLLVEAGFITLSGERTQNYDEVLMDKLAVMLKDEVVTDLKLIAKAKKASK